MPNIILLVKPKKQPKKRFTKKVNHSEKLSLRGYEPETRAVETDITPKSNCPEKWFLQGDTVVIGFLFTWSAKIYLIAQSARLLCENPSNQIE